MNSRHVLVALAVVFSVLLVACGPSTEEIAQMAAAAATDTPVPTETPLPTNTPTPSPTPIPIDLTVTVTDEEGSPIPFANVSLPESGDDEPVAVDASGQVSWANLAGEAVNLSVTAQGYSQADEGYTLERGPNEITVQMARAPFGLLPSEACGLTETPLYIEDFQDRRAPELQEIDFNAQGWSMVDDEVHAGNVFAQAVTTEAEGAAFTGLWTEFDNAVWRTYFNIGETGGMSFNWKSAGGFDLDGVEIFDSRYQMVFQANGSVEARRLQQPVSNIAVTRGFVSYTRDWDLLEISSYNGEVTVWLNGQQIMSYTDPIPVPAGGMGYELWYPVTLQIDNISVCELSTPFETLYMPPVEE